MGRLWDLIEDHRDAQQYPPSYRQLAIKLGVSQSLFVTWKAPKSLPSRESIESIARVVGVSYQTVLDAALEDTRYRIPPSEDLEERDGDDRDAAPMKRAAESAATERDSAVPHPDDLDLAALAKPVGGSRYERDAAASGGLGEESQDQGGEGLA